MRINKYNWETKKMENMPENEKQELFENLEKSATKPTGENRIIKALCDGDLNHPTRSIVTLQELLDMYVSITH